MRKGVQGFCFLGATAPKSNEFKISCGKSRALDPQETGSRLSFCHRAPERVSEGVSEGFLRGPCTCQPKDPSKPLQSAFKNPSRALQEGVEIDDALGFPKLSNQLQGPGVLLLEQESLESTGSNRAEGPILTYFGPAFQLHPHMTPHTRPSIRARKQLRGLLLGRTTP